jgi:polyisoprenoid-binding protein YceI
MTRTRSIALAVVAIVAIGVGGYLVYDTFLRGDAVAPLALPSASADPLAEASPSAMPSDATSATTEPAASPPADDGDLAGAWTVAAGSEAGYRVREQLANLPAESDAVGRTSDVTGAIVLVEGDSIELSEGTLEVDTTTIVSDEGRRDNRLRDEGLQTDQYPTASFTITQPVEVPASALEGAASDITLVGDLTLHGVTKAVEIPAQALLADGQIQVAGSITFPLSDYDITAPNIGGFIVSIADEGTLEFLIAFERS